MKTISSLFLSTFFIACAHAQPALETVKQVEIPRFMGSWYVIANIPTSFEKGATNAIEKYTWNEKKDRIDIDFTFHKDSPSGELRSIPQKGFIYNSTTNAEWRVQPFWPLRLAYLILELDSEYQYTVIGVPSRKYVWIMARTPQLNKETYDLLVERLKTIHLYSVDELQTVQQSW